MFKAFLQRGGQLFAALGGGGRDAGCGAVAAPEAPGAGPAGERLVFEIAVRHGYYAPEPCAGLRWSCLPDSLRRLQQAGCVVRPTAEGVAVYAQEGQLEGLRALAGGAGEPLELLLLAYGEGCEFAHATAGLGGGGRLLLLDGTAVTVPEADGWYALRVNAPAEAASCGRAEVLGLDARALLRELPPAERGTVPAFAVRLRIEDGPGDIADWAAQALGRRWRVDVQARATYWKYLLPPEWAAQQPCVVDPAGEVAFGPPVLEPTPGGGQVLAIFSCSPIPLQRHPGRHFWLQALAPQADNVLVQRLPPATPGVLRRVYVDGAPRLVSEIPVQG